VKVLLIQGGASSEREISLKTGHAISEGLRTAGHEIVPFDTTPEGKPDTRMVRRLADVLDAQEPDVAFIALHGGDGEDGHVQALLDLVGLPYTGSGMLSAAVSMDKAVSKELFERHGVPTPAWALVTAADGDAALGLIPGLGGYPVVTKPAGGGSTVGLSIVRSAEALAPALHLAFVWDTRVLIEAFIPGRELTVSVIDGEALPVIEIVPKSGFYDYHSKYTAGATDYHCPAALSDADTRTLQALAVKAASVLRCRGAARADFRFTDDGKPYCLEVNTIPGMTATSLLPMAARASGTDFPALLDRLVRSARVR
jgi:D-alanine-D-alanine ligase